MPEPQKGWARRQMETCRDGGGMERLEGLAKNDSGKMTLNVLLC